MVQALKRKKSKNKLLALEKSMSSSLNQIQELLKIIICFVQRFKQIIITQEEIALECFIPKFKGVNPYLTFTIPINSLKKDSDL